MTMTEVVKLLSQLVKICGEGKASSSVAQGSAVKFKADVDEKLLNKLKHKQLVDLYQELAGWEPHPHLATYHISFLKNYLALLVHFQQHRTSKVSEKINKTLFNWIFHINDRYVRYLKKLGVQVSLKVEGEGED